MKISVIRIHTCGLLCLSLLSAPSIARIGQARKHNRLLSPILLAQLSDDFESNSLDPSWNDQYPFRVSSATVINDSLTLVPNDAINFGWYGTSTGLFLSKNIPPAVTNFVVETSVTVSSVDSGGLPTGDWHSAGLMIRSSTNGGNLMQVNLGRQGPAFGMPRIYGTQAMSTVNSGSTFNYVAATGPEMLSGRLRICRIGSQIVLLRNLVGDGGGWQPLAIQQNDDASENGYFQRNDLSGDVEVGIVMSHWRNSEENVQGIFDYVRFAAPSSFEECFVDDLDELVDPIAPTDAPVEPTDAPVEPTDAPVEPTIPPVEPTDAPVEPTDVPVEPTDAPVEPTIPPVEPTDAPVEPTDAPVEPTDAPVEPTIPPVEPTDAPVESPSEPIDSLSDEFFVPYVPTSDEWEWIDEYPDRYNSLSIANGILSIMPSGPDVSNVWYDNSHGSFVHKRIPSNQNFLVETLINVRNDLTNEPPSGNWHVGGLLVRSVENIDNWLTVNLGQQGPSGRFNLPRTLGVEGKTTSNAFSTFNYVPLNPDDGFGPGISVRLRLCRVGSSFALLYRPLDRSHWIPMSPYADQEVNDNIDAVVDRSSDMMDGDIDVGIMTNRMFAGPEFTARFDYVRFGEVSALEDCYGGMVVS